MKEKLPHISWLKSQSITANLIRSTDWSKNALGPIQDWPSSLTTSINLCLDSQFPMYVWWGPEYVMIYNDAYIDLAGPKKHPTYFGRPAQEMWTEIWPTLQGFLAEVKATGKSILHEDLLMPVKRLGKPEEAYFTFSYGPARDDSGEIQGIHCTCFETTGKIVAEKKLTSQARDLSLAVATRDEFMSIASHELKTPLTSLRLQTQSMQRNIKRGISDALSSERVGRLIENTDKQVTRLIRLVDDMLDVSQIESGKMSINFERLDLKDILDDVYDQLKEQFENAKSKPHLDLVSGAIGDFDRSRIEQVITNLFTNAMRYGQGKDIHISLQIKGSVARLSVKDNGVGIASENFDKVFKRFERIISPHEINGLGLGLFITKQIVFAHQGKIWVESELGSGSTFFVELPLTHEKT